MNKKLIRLTESDLHRIVKESVNRVLKESNGSTPRNIAYGLMVMLGDIQNELMRGGDPVTIDEIDKLYGMATQLSDYFDSLNESKRIGSKKRLIKESVNSWMGCQRIKMIWHGEWSDPELEYNGSIANYWDVEDWCAEACREEGVNPNDKNAFANWIKQNEDRVGMTIQEMCGNF